MGPVAAETTIKMALSEIENPIFQEFPVQRRSSKPLEANACFFKEPSGEDAQSRTRETSTCIYKKWAQ